MTSDWDDESRITSDPVENDHSFWRRTVTRHRDKTDGDPSPLTDKNDVLTIPDT